MKKYSLFSIIAIIFFSCVSNQTPKEDMTTLKTSITDEEKSSEDVKEQEVIEDLEIIKSKDLSELFSSGNTYSIDESVILPHFRIDKKLPSDPIEKLIVLKQMYYQYNQLQTSPLLEDTVISLEYNEDTYYLGTLKGGVFEYNSFNVSTGKILVEPYESIKNRAITELVYKDDKLFIASFSGLYEFDLIKDQKSIIFDGGDLNSVLCLLDSGDNIFWGTSGGSLYTWNNHRVEKLFQFDSSIRAIVPYNNKLIIGTGGGDLFLWDEKSSTVQIIDYLTKGVSSRINDILVNNNNLYIGTSKGVIKYDFSNNDTRVLIDNLSISTISQTEKYIYFGTNSRGVIIYDKIEESFRYWDLTTGLPSLEITTLKTFGNKVYLGMPNKGIVIINEEILKKL